MKTKFKKVSVSDRLPDHGEDVILIDKDNIAVQGYLSPKNNWIIYSADDYSEINFWLEEVPDREEEMRETINIYKECFEKFIPSEYWDEATEYLSTANNGLAKDLLRREK